MKQQYNNDSRDSVCKKRLCEMQSNHDVHQYVEDGLHPEVVPMLQKESVHFVKRVFDGE
ncbi:hypothetical protein V7110_03915 [Neobacillus drentensis]